MRRAGGLWSHIASFDNLLVATFRAARGKRLAAGVARFLERREPQILRLLEELEAESYRPGAGRSFRILDPKPRVIHAAPFRDRVLHHALIDPLEPIFDRRMIFDSYACRRGKGTHAALARAQCFLRRYRHFASLDIEGFFGSLDHDVVLETLQRIIKDRRVLRLCDVIVRATPPAPGAVRSERGLPIGNLTSQWFANLVLDRLDHEALETLRVPGYLRYMDDMVLFDDDRARLHATLEAVRQSLARLRLSLKEPATILAPARQGLPFLGRILYPGISRLRPSNRRRTRARLRHRRWEFRRGRIGEQQLADSLRSVAAHLRAGGGSAAQRRSLLTPTATTPARRATRVSHRVNRGGSFNNTAVNARSANRNRNAPGNRNNNLGLRPSNVSQRPIAAAGNAQSFAPAAPCP